MCVFSIQLANSSMTGGSSSKPAPVQTPQITGVSHICFFCCSNFICSVKNLSKNVIVVCDDCMGKRDEIRQAILGFHSILDRLTLLESQVITENAAVVSEQVKNNSESIKQLTVKQDLSDRKMNLIVCGLDEVQVNFPDQETKNILAHIDLPGLSCSTTRIGKSKLARISFALERDRTAVLKNARKLKGHEKYEKVMTVLVKVAAELEFYYVTIIM